MGRKPQRRKKVRTQRTIIQKSKVGKTSLPTWDEETFLSVCKDRGFYSRRTVVYYLAKEMNLTTKTVDTILTTGKIRWEYILFIGAYFEMTPKEFCDVFLSGYFQEAQSGIFRAWLQDPIKFIASPVPTAAKTREEKKQERIDKITAQLEEIGLDEDE